MSEQEKTVEENIDVERAVSFFKDLYDYFRRDPKALTLFLHTVSENLVNMIVLNTEFRKDLGFAAGQLRIASNLIWYHDNDEFIQHVVTSSPNLEQLMAVISELAKAYSKLRSDENVSLTEIESLIENAATTLYNIVDYIMTDIDSDP